MAVRKTQMPNCNHRRSRNFSVVRIGNTTTPTGKPHMKLQCATCGTIAGNATKWRKLTRWDTVLQKRRAEELRKRRAA